MSKVFQALQLWLTRLNSAESVWVGFSGGLDSTVLLHAAMSLGLPRVKALHINHQLSPFADYWQQQSQQVADMLGCEFQAVRVDVGCSGGLEQAAREARYGVFEQYVGAGEVLLMAHHANDQTETLLYRLMRGAGLRGLAGIPVQRPLRSKQADTDSRGEIIRPLLEVPREQLEAYALQHHLRWVDDDSNSDSRFDRNYLRHSVVPSLTARWPHALKQIARSARLLSESDSLLNDYLAADFAGLDVRIERAGYSLCVQAFTRHSWLKQRHLLRYWFSHHQILVPSEAQLDQVRNLLLAANDASPVVSWGDDSSGDDSSAVPGCQLFRYQKRLYLCPRLPAINAGIKTWRAGQVCDLDGFVLNASRAGAGLPDGVYTLRYRSGGERCRPAGRAHSQTLKKLLQAHQLEPWLRDRVPLIYSGETLVAVADLWLCEGVAVAGGWQPEWRSNYHF